MVRQLLSEERNAVVKLWLDGNTYREIQESTKVSLGAISSVIDEERKRNPDIDELRKLKAALKEARAGVTDALRGATLLARLNNMNIPIDRIHACINLVEQYDGRAGEVLEWGQRLKELEASLGKTYQEIVSDAAQRARQAQDSEVKLENLRREEQTVKESIRDLEQLKTLNNKIGRHNITLPHLDALIEQNVTLQELNFTPEAAGILAFELQKLSLDPQKAAATLVSLLSQYESLQKAVGELQAQKNTLQDDIQAKVVDQQNAKRLLNELVERIDILEKEFTPKREELESGIRKLETEAEAHRKEIQGLKSEEMAVRTSLEKAQIILKNIDENMAKMRPLATLAFLVEDPPSQLDPATVLKVAIALLEGLRTHAKAHPRLVSNPLAIDQELQKISDMLAVELRLATRKAQ